MLQTQSSRVVFKADIALFQNVLAFFWEYWIGLGGEGYRQGKIKNRGK